MNRDDAAVGDLYHGTDGFSGDSTEWSSQTAAQQLAHHSCHRGAHSDHYNLLLVVSELGILLGLRVHCADSSSSLIECIFSFNIRLVHPTTMRIDSTPLRETPDGEYQTSEGATVTNRLISADVARIFFPPPHLMTVCCGGRNCTFEDAAKESQKVPSQGGQYLGAQGQNNMDRSNDALLPFLKGNVDRSTSYRSVYCSSNNMLTSNIMHVSSSRRESDVMRQSRLGRSMMGLSMRQNAGYNMRSIMHHHYANHRVNGPFYTQYSCLPIVGLCADTRGFRSMSDDSYQFPESFESKAQHASDGQRDFVGCDGRQSGKKSQAQDGRDRAAVATVYGLELTYPWPSHGPRVTKSISVSTQSLSRKIAGDNNAMDIENEQAYAKQRGTERLETEANVKQDNPAVACATAALNSATTTCMAISKENFCDPFEFVYEDLKKSSTTENEKNAADDASPSFPPPLDSNDRYVLNNIFSVCGDSHGFLHLYRVNHPSDVRPSSQPST